VVAVFQREVSQPKYSLVIGQAIEGSGLARGLDKAVRLGLLSLAARPDVKPEPLFGDVETRIERVDRGSSMLSYSLSWVGKLGIAERISERCLSTSSCLLQPRAWLLLRDEISQGIEALRMLEHLPTRAEWSGESAVGFSRNQQSPCWRTRRGEGKPDSGESMYCFRGCRRTVCHKIRETP